MPFWTNGGAPVIIDRFRVCLLPSSSASPLSSLTVSPAFGFTYKPNYNMSSSFSSHSHAHSSRSGGGEQSRGLGGCGRGRGAGGGGGSCNDKIDALGRLMTRILRHMASDLNLSMRSDGFVKLQDLLKLNMKTFANVPLISHTVDDVKEGLTIAIQQLRKMRLRIFNLVSYFRKLNAVRKDNKQRFSLLDENGELWIRANQGHTLETVETESLLRPILSVEEVPVCVHGTYKKNLESILESGLKRMQRLHVHFSCGLPTDSEVISGIRRNVNVLIFLDVKKALEDGMKLYISDNRVILTEGFNGVVRVKYFERIESWPDRHPITFQAQI